MRSLHLPLLCLCASIDPRYVQATDGLPQSEMGKTETLAFPHSALELSNFAHQHPNVTVIDPPDALYQVGL